MATYKIDILTERTECNTITTSTGDVSGKHVGRILNPEAVDNSIFTQGTHTYTFDSEAVVATGHIPVQQRDIVTSIGVNAWVHVMVNFSFVGCASPSVL